MVNKSESESTLVAKSLIGVLSQGITWPLEYAKIMRQMENNNGKNTYNMMKNDIKTNGMKIMFRSMIPNVISSVPRFITRFTIYENMMKSNNKMINMSAGVTAGAFEAAIIMTPSEAIKIQLIKQPDKTIIQTIKHIWHINGIMGFWKGGTPTIIRQGSTQGISLYTNQILNPVLTPHLGKSTGIVTGIIGGALAVMINNPIDVIKTRQQEKMDAAKIKNEIYKIYKINGLKGFYDGALFRICRIAPLHGITYFLYDLLKK